MCWTSWSWSNYTPHSSGGEYISIWLFSSDTLCWLTSNQGMRWPADSSLQILCADWLRIRACDGRRYFFLCRQIMMFLLFSASYHSRIPLFLQVHCTPRPAWPYLFYTVQYLGLHPHLEFNTLGLTTDLLGWEQWI